MAEVVAITSAKDIDKLRWKANIRYRSDAGENSREVFFNEIQDLHWIIEDGPDWHCMIDCVVTLNCNDADMLNLTIEQSREL